MSVRNNETTCDVDILDSSDDEQRAPAAKYNRLIFRVRKRILREFSPRKELFQFSVLEIASGSGQHVDRIALHFPHGLFQPSVDDPDLLATLYAKKYFATNVKKPLLIDVCQKLSSYNFKEKSIDVIYNVNIISTYECTKGLFSNAGLYLKYNGIMITHGLYALNGVITSDGNIRFHDDDDESLRSGNPPGSLIGLKDLIALANENHLLLKEVTILPFEMKCFVWIKELPKAKK